MKKSTTIHLVLITAALAACNRPLYQQDTPEYYQQPQDFRGDPADSTNSCPLGASQSDLPPDYYTWYSGFRPYGYDYGGDPFFINSYYFFRYSATIIRAGFGRGWASGHS